MSSLHLGQYKGNFYIIDEVLIANFSPARVPVTRMRFQIVPFSYPCVSNRSNSVCVFIIVFIVSV